MWWPTFQPACAPLPSLLRSLVTSKLSAILSFFLIAICHHILSRSFQECQQYIPLGFIAKWPLIGCIYNGKVRFLDGKIQATMNYGLYFIRCIIHFYTYTKLLLCVYLFIKYTKMSIKINNQLMSAIHSKFILFSQTEK